MRKGLRVKGRLLESTRGQGARDSGTDPPRAQSTACQHRLSNQAEGRERMTRASGFLTELELWEVSLVTFPMLPSARVGAKGEVPEAETWRELAAALRDAGRELARD